MRSKIIAMLLVASMSTSVTADGPLFAIWHIDGHGYQWQQEQRDAGYPVEATIRMIAANLRDGGAVVDGVPKQIGILNGNAPLLSQMSGGPIVLRMNNITNEIDDTLPRIAPLTSENWHESILCVRLTAEGTLDQTPNPDPFGPMCQWTEVGRQWAIGAWMQRLQEIVQPSAIILRENNEGPRIKFKQLFSQVSVKKKDANGVVYYEITNTWKSRPTLESISIRIADWVDERRSLDPSACESEFSAAERERYQALYAGFRENLSEAWRAVPFRTVGYGGPSENTQNDASSPPYYLGYFRSPDLTAPGAYDVLDFGGSWSEYSISIGNPPGASVYGGYAAGRHAVVDPESFAGLMSHVSWRMQSPGREVRLTYWDNAATKPDHLIFADGTNSPTLKQVHVDALTGLGRDDLLTLTIEDYELATLRALARIPHHPVINRYWREGTTRLLYSPLNDATATRVYATETTIPGIEQKLLHVYTPCELSGEVDVGEHTITLLPGDRSVYFRTNVTERL